MLQSKLNHFFFNFSPEPDSKQLTDSVTSDLIHFDEQLNYSPWYHSIKNIEMHCMFFPNFAKCLFVCLFEVLRSTRDFSLIWWRHHYWWRASNFDLHSALLTKEQWGFFSVPHLLWHGTSVYNGHVPLSIYAVAERLLVELSLPVFYDLGLSRLGFVLAIYKPR